MINLISELQLDWRCRILDQGSNIVLSVVLVKGDAHGSHVLAVTYEFGDVILHLNCVICDLELSISTIVVIDERNLTSGGIVIKILELLGRPSKLCCRSITERSVSFLGGLLLVNIVLLMKILEHRVLFIELTLFQFISTDIRRTLIGAS